MILRRVFLEHSRLDNELSLRSSLINLRADGRGTMGTEIFVFVSVG
jgi:hypothetical protein